MTGQPTSKPACPSCGDEVAPDAPRGYCLKCLFALGTAAPDSVLAKSDRQLDTQSPEPETTAARSFGDYELLEQIARGGMGVVYRARQKSLNRIVAVKMLLWGELSGKEVAQRFRTEAAAAASLQHANIVAIHEVSAHESQPFFVMDFIEGQSLARLAASQPLPAARAARYVKIVSDAIHYAHERGILHRDLKPSNVLIDPFDQPRVTDFGLAKRLHHDSELTLSGQVLGSPNYMPPEQAAAKRGLVGRRSDVYSLGAILYHLLTGRPPFVGETLTDTLHEVLNTEPVSPRLLNPSVPRDLETLCLKCLEKEPARRYQTAQALAEDLDRFLRDEPIQARPVSRSEKLWRWCGRKPVVACLGAATMALLLAIGVGSPIAVYRVNHERQRAEKGELAARQKTYASDMDRVQQALAKNNLGRALELLHRHRPQAKSEIQDPKSESRDLRGWEWRYLWQQCQGEERFILSEHANGASFVGLLPDGKTVFSFDGDKFVRLWDLESRRQVGLLPHADEVIGAAASSDGRWLASTTAKEGEARPVLLWDLATQKIAATLATNFWLRDGSITFSPDSKWLAFATHFGGIRLWDVNARREFTNLAAFDSSRSPIGMAFSPDSRRLAYNEDEHGAIRLWDLENRSVERLVGHHALVRSLAFSPDGRTLVSGSQDRTARLWNFVDRRVRMELTNHTGGAASTAFSPDGRTLAMVGSGRVIRLVDVETGNQKAELRGHLKSITSLAFTSDGQTLLSAGEDGTIRVWNLVPRPKERVMHVFAQNSLSTEWRSYGTALFLSPGGRHLLVIHTEQTFSVWDTLHLSEGERRPLPFTNTIMAAIAPDGRLAAFGSRSGEVVTWEAGASQARPFAWPTTNRIQRLVFSSDGRSLAIADDAKILSEMAGSNDDPRRTVRVWDVGARKETHLLSPEGAFVMSLAFSQDSKTLLAGSWRGTVMLWPLTGPSRAVTFPGHSAQVQGLALLSDGQTFISSGPDIRFWDVPTRRENSPKLTTGAHSLALSPDGRRFATGATDGSIKIWDIASHEEVATLEGHNETVRRLAFTSDGNHLVSVSKDQLRIWHAPSWAEIEAVEKQSQRDRK